MKLSIDTAAIRRHLELLFRPGDIFEIRVPECRDNLNSKYTYTCAGYFSYDAIETAAQQVAALDAAIFAPIIYVTLNPVSPGLLARAVNRIKRKAREATKDEDAVRRRSALIDVDPVRPAGISSTDKELATARERAQAIVAYLKSLGWPPPIIALSGNGYHLIYPIDLPCDDNGLVSDLLNALGDRFDDAAVKIDRSVFNPARVSKVIGTVSRKGDDLRGVEGIEDRPHRLSQFVEIPNDIVAVTESQLQLVLKSAAKVKKSKKASTAAKTAPTPTAVDELEHTPAGVRAWLERHGIVVKGERRSGNKTLLLLDQCPIDPSIVSTGESDIAVLVGDDGKLSYCNKHNRGVGFTWHDLRQKLNPCYSAPFPLDDEVDLSQFSTKPPAELTDAPEADSPTPRNNPGPVPDTLLRVPGFIGEVMDFCLSTAPYPNQVMAFGGALALLGFLAGRKVRDPGDNRTNIYILGLAHSSAGKDWPRKLNMQIAHKAGMAQCMGERLASGEGIEDALFADPSMLVQTDEIDGMLQSINKSKDARHESMMGTLLTLYSSSNSVYPMRRKAGKSHPGVINQPCLVLFGTAIPNHYYEALSERMLTNGFFARMLILEAGPRTTGQEPSILEMPQRIVETAQYWAARKAGTGNLAGCNPKPITIDQTENARRILVETRLEAEAEYSKAESVQDAVGTTVWGRVSETTRKLALIYAVSENHKTPTISADAVLWASTLVMHQVRRMLFMADGHVAENPFHAECLRVMSKLRDAPDKSLPHHVLLKRMKIDAKSFRDVIDTLVQRTDIVIEQSGTGGRTKIVYRLAGEGREGRVKEVV